MPSKTIEEVLGDPFGIGNHEFQQLWPKLTIFLQQCSAAKNRIGKCDFCWGLAL
jgi:hypothetical protein